MPKVRTTFRPDEALEVSDAEAADLANQGLLVNEQSKEQPKPPVGEKAK